MLIKIQKSENSDGICFTKNILEAAQMKVGDEVQVQSKTAELSLKG